MCTGNGWCSDGVSGSGLCFCNADATGFGCQYTRSSTCSGRGTPQYSGTCICDKGYTGTYCQNCDINHYRVNGECRYCESAVTCSGYGTCQSDATCKCRDGFMAADCKACAPNHFAWPTCKKCIASETCNNRGTCDIVTGNCICRAPFIGTNCNQCPSNLFGSECKNCPTYSTSPPSAACSGLGTCSDGFTGSGVCTCTPGFGGADCADPFVTVISPQNGPSNGVFDITLQGNLFGVDGGVVILSDPSNAAYTKQLSYSSYSSSTITAQMPVSDLSSRPLAINVKNGNRISSTTLRFTYDPPTITRLVPANLPTTGGTISIQGASLGVWKSSPTQAQVKLDATVLTIEGWDDVYGKSAKVQIPAGVGSGKQLRITTHTGDSVSISYSYQVPVVTSAVTDPPPAVQPTTGGSVVLIKGRNFGMPAWNPSSPPTVTIGGAPCPLVSSTLFTYTDTDIKCTAPAGRGASQSVIVTVASQSSVGATVFDYAPPKVTSVSGCTPLGSDPSATSDCPTTGTGPGSTIIYLTIIGTNFGASATGLLVTVGNNFNCAAVTTIDPHTKIRCTLPPGSGINLPVKVSRDTQVGIKEKALSYAGPYILPNSLERLAPTVQGRGTSVTAATTSGGDTVRFEGKSFGTNAGVITVTYGTNEHPAMFPCALSSVSDTSITCKTGGGEGANLHFRVMVGIVASNVGTDSYNYPSPTIKSGTLRPSSATTGSNTLTGVMTQGEELSFDGTNFGSQRGRNLQVTYGPVSDPTAYICAVVANKTTDTKVTCTTSPGDGGDYIFRVIVGPESVPALGTDRFTYPTAPKVISVDCPNTCVLSTGTGTISRCPTDALQIVSRLPAILTVIGANFGANGAIVTVGGKPCVNTRHDSTTPDSRIYCTLPPGTGINLNVVVNQGPLYSVGKPAVSYMEPEITAVKGCRNTGADTIDCDRNGGTLITVLGKAFGESLAKVIIGGVPCPGTAAGGAVDHCPNDPHGCVTCYTPKGTALSQPVLLIQNHGIISGSLTSTAPVRSLSYRQCQPGTYAPSNIVTCKQCDPGTFSDVEGADACGLCAPGTFSLAGAPKCTSCAVGTYQSLSGQSSCTQCSPGSYQSAIGQISCNPCTPGFYAFGYAAPACTPCSAGTSQPAFNATSCVQCDRGFATEDVGSRYCKPCTIGYVASEPGQVRCQACPINTYTNEAAQTKCQTCESGRYTRGATASKFCEPCLAGTFLDYSSANNTGLCVPCPAGYSSGPGASRCDACSAGKFSDKAGSDSCQACGTGTFSSEGAITCLACAPGKSQPAPGKAQCEECDVGKVQAASGQSACTPCPGGRYVGARGLQICSDCGPGTYGEESGLGSCTSCAAGRYSSGGAMRCEDCPAGQYYNGTGATACVLCEAGTYYAGTGATACTPCDHGKYQISTGQIQCQFCSAGTYSWRGQRQCTPAEPGTYQPETGKNDTRPCPIGTSSPISGAVQCAACPDGKYSDSEGLANCRLCPAGQWAIQNGGGVGVTSCTNCSIGYFTPDMGYPECLPCTPGRWTNKNGTSVCNECSPGTVQPAENATSCIQCPVGQYQDVSQQTACSDCPPGKYSNQTGLSTCVQCSPGSVQTAYGQTSCVACGIGFFQNSPGQARCLACEPGRFGNITGMGTCSPCPEGYFTSTYGNTACEGCKSGTSNPSRGLSACRDCGFGKFNNKTTQAECTPCPAGEHQDRQGAQQCVACGVGRFAPSTGYTDCEACPVGRYSNEIHAQTCIACPPGRWQDAVGSTSCKETPAGSFSALEAVKYSQCAPSMIAPIPGLEQCIACNTFAVSNDDMTKCLCTSGYFQERDIYNGQSGGTTDVGTGNGTATGTASGSGNQTINGNSTMNGNNTISTAGKWNATNSSSGGYMPSSSTGGASPSSTGGNIPGGITSVPANSNNTIITSGGNNGTNSSVPSSASSSPTSSPTSSTGTGVPLPPSASVTALQCISCPRGANCTSEGVTYDTLTTSRGYWRNTSDERYALNFYKCLVTAHCTGGRNSSCGGNRDGVICAICLPGYRSTTGLADCTECPSKSRSIAASFFIILAFFVVLVAMYYIVLRTDRPLMKNQADRDAGVREWDAYNFMADTPTSEGAPNLNNTPVISTESRSRPNFTYKMKIMLSFLQISTNMSFFVDVPWPNHYVEFIRAFTFVNLDFVPWQSIGCVSLFDFFDKFLIITIAPIIILLLIYLCYLLPMYYLDRRDMSDDAGFRLARKRSRRKFWKLVLFTTFLIYPTVSTTIFSFLNCKRINDEWYLLQDFTIHCYSPKWNSYLAADIIMMILYPIGIPIFLFYLLNRYRHRLMEPGVRVQLGFLFEAYQSNLWWFELVDMLHKLCMTSLLRFFLPELQMGDGMMVLTLYTIVLLGVKPYVRKADDRLHLFTQIELYLIVFMGYILYRTDTQQADNLTDILLSIILIILTIGVMLMFVFMMIANVRKMWREHQRKKMLKTSVVADPSEVLSSSGRSSRPSARTHNAHPDALNKDDIVPAETNGETCDDPTPESSAAAGNHETDAYQESNAGSFPNQSYGVSLEPGASGMFPARGPRQHMPSSSSSISDRLPNSSGSYPAVSPRQSSHHRNGSQSSHHARTNTIIAAPIDHREHADGTYSNNPAIRTMRISEQMELEANKAAMSQPSSNSTSPGLTHRRLHSKASPPTTYRSPQFHHSRQGSTISNATMYSSPAMMSSPQFHSPSYNPQFNSPSAALGARTPMALPPAMPDMGVDDEQEVLSVDVVMPNQMKEKDEYHTDNIMSMTIIDETGINWEKEKEKEKGEVDRWTVMNVNVVGDGGMEISHIMFDVCIVIDHHTASSIVT